MKVLRLRFLLLLSNVVVFLKQSGNLSIINTVVDKKGTLSDLSLILCRQDVDESYFLTFLYKA